MKLKPTSPPPKRFIFGKGWLKGAVPFKRFVFDIPFSSSSLVVGKDESEIGGSEMAIFISYRLSSKEDGFS